MGAPWAAVVVNYEAGDALTACVASLLADDSAGTPEIVVVDNGSSDGSVRTLRAAFPELRVVGAGGNVGYAAAANRGIAATTAPVVAVCNPDLVVRPGTAAAMLGVLRADPAVGAVGPRVLNPDGSTYPSARRDPTLGDAVGHAALGPVWPTNLWTRRYRALDADPDRARDVDWASGAALWLRRSAIDAIGGWDEGFFMYMEDVDVGWRLRAAGWRVRYEPAGAVVHVQGLSTDRRPTRMILEHHRSSYRFAAKRWHGAKRLLLLPAAAFLAVRALALVAASWWGSRRDPSEATR